MYLFLLAGFIVGLGGFTFVYANAASYLSSDAAACANCHIMKEQYSGWQKSSHRLVAKCNDCHMPHEFFAKWGMKALNGMRHSWAFTTGWFKEPIFITPMNQRVTENACKFCHAAMTSEMAHEAPGGERSCITCHRSVGHLH
jgi:cytochrome c nitrite reductase small subunit